MQLFSRNKFILQYRRFSFHFLKPGYRALYFTNSPRYYKLIIVWTSKFIYQGVVIRGKEHTIFCTAFMCWKDEQGERRRVVVDSAPAADLVIRLVIMVC